MALSGLMTKVHFASKVPLLMKATSADSELPSGYIYDEIARITFESLEQSDILVEFLTERLRKNSPQIKLKVLLIMKAVVERGHKEFCHSLSKQAEGIREAKSYSGQSDPLHGDALNVRVRDAAGELLQSLFDTDRSFPVNRFVGKDEKNFNQMEGFGYSGAMNLQGYGRNEAATKQEPRFINDVFQRVKDNISYTFNQNVSSITKYHQPQSMNSSIYHPADNKFVTMPSKTFNIIGSSKSSLASGDCDNANHNEDVFEEKLDPDSEVKGKIEAAELDLKHNTISANDDWSQEIRLVNDITVSGGIKLNPGRSEMDHFIKSCELLDFQKIMELMRSKLYGSEYKVQMKALFVIENLLNSSIPNTYNVISEKLLESIDKLTNSNQKSVKNKATKILHLLKPRTYESNQTISTCISQKPDKTSVFGDLLSIENDHTSATNKVHSNSKQDDSSSDLFLTEFDGLTFQGQSSQQLEIEKPLNSVFDVSDQGYRSLGNADDLFASRQADQGSVSVEQHGMNAVKVAESSTGKFTLSDFDPFTGIQTTKKIDNQRESKLKEAGPDKLNVVQDQYATGRQFSKENLDIHSTLIESASTNSISTGNLLLAAGNRHYVQSSTNVPYQAYTANPTSTSQEINNTMIMQQKFVISPHRTGNCSSVATNVSSHFNTINNVPKAAAIANLDNLIAVNRNTGNCLPANQFQFLSTAKPAAFDFVKEAMEASKKKSN